MNSETLQTGRDFEVAGIPKRALVTLLLSTIALPLLLVAIAAVASADSGALQALPLVAGVSLPLAALLVWAMHRRRIRLDQGELAISAAFYRRRVPLQSLDLAASRVVNLDEHSELRPLLRTNGFGLPGYQAGHYRLRDRRHAFCLVTAPQVLLLHERKGGVILLSPARPHALRQALQAAHAA